MAANSGKDRVFQQFSVLPSERPVKVVAPVLYMAQRVERVDVHACKTLSSGIREASFWPRNGLRTNLIASKFKTFPWGACLPDPLVAVCLHTHY